MVWWMVRDRNYGPVFGSDADSYPNSNTYCRPNINSRTYFYAHANCYTASYGDTRTNSNTNTYPSLWGLVF